MAAIEPKTMDRIANTHNICCHPSVNFSNPMIKILAVMAKTANFGADAKNSVVGVGDPSYTSGAHI